MAGRSDSVTVPRALRGTRGTHAPPGTGCPSSIRSELANTEEVLQSNLRARSGSSASPDGTSESHDRDLDVVDRGQRIKQAIPLLTALPPDPELTGRRAEIERGGLEPVNV